MSNFGAIVKAFADLVDRAAAAAGTRAASGGKPSEAEALPGLSARQIAFLPPVSTSPDRPVGPLPPHPTFASAFPTRRQTFFRDWMGSHESYRNSIRTRRIERSTTSRIVICTPSAWNISPAVREPSEFVERVTAHRLELCRRSAGAAGTGG